MDILYCLLLFINHSVLYVLVSQQILFKIPLPSWNVINVLTKEDLFFSLQVFVGKIPRDLYEDELVPLFEKAGPIWDLRLMMDPLSGQNRGYAFITFCSKDAAQEAVKLVSHSEWDRILLQSVIKLLSNLLII